MIASKKKNILFVEDDVDITEVVADILSPKYNFFAAGTLKEANSIVALKDDIDLILLDFNLPDGKGNQFCSQLKGDKRTRDIPIIFLTGRADLQDKSSAFASGASDYITKPFEILELDMRIEARLNEVNKQSEQLEEISFVNLMFDLAKHKLYKVGDDGDREEIELTPMEIKLFRYLLENRERVLSREQLVEKVWGDNINVADRTVDRHISRLRTKIDDQALAINPVHGVGYIFEKKKIAS